MYWSYVELAKTIKLKLPPADLQKVEGDILIYL